MTTTILIYVSCEATQVIKLIIGYWLFTIHVATNNMNDFRIFLCEQVTALVMLGHSRNVCQNTVIFAGYFQNIRSQFWIRFCVHVLGRDVHMSTGRYTVN